MFEELEGKNQLLMEAELKPVQGHVFQPTGFPDIGAATYQLPDGTRMILLESSQSMANRLEEQILGPDGELLRELEGLSYIKIRMEGQSNGTTNSLLEAHRLNSPFIMSDPDFQDRFKKEADYEKGKHLNWQKIAKTVFKYDVNSLLHGLFLANLEDGRIKVPRALSAFIEARGAKEVVSGGVKFNFFDPTGTIRAENYDKDVYGNVPYQRVEYTAETITGYFNLDLDLLRSYSLQPAAQELITLLALYKIRAFLDGSIRLRSRCHLALVNGLKVTEPSDYEVPVKPDLLADLQRSIGKCRQLFAAPPITEIVSKVVIKEEKKSPEATEEDNDDVSESEDTAEKKPQTKSAKKRRK